MGNSSCLRCFPLGVPLKPNVLVADSIGQPVSLLIRTELRIIGPSSACGTVLGEFTCETSSCDLGRSVSEVTPGEKPRPGATMGVSLDLLSNNSERAPSKQRFQNGILDPISPNRFFGPQKWSRSEVIFWPLVTERVQPGSNGTDKKPAPFF